jgi:hypothetical protein
MTLASILHEHERLPLADRIFVVEQASASINAEKTRGIRAVDDSLSEDYRASQDLTESTQFDKEEFIEAVPKTGLVDKLTAGLHLAYQRMLEFKHQKNSEVVVMRDGKIVRLKP